MVIVQKFKSIRQFLLTLSILKDLKEMRNILRRKRRSCAVRKLNLNRNSSGYFQMVFLKMKAVDHEQFFIHTRMTVPVFNELLNLLTPFLSKSSIREPISPEHRLSLTLLYLSQGNSMQSLAWSWKLGKETVRQIILETSRIIWDVLSKIDVLEPTENDFERIAEEFWEQWNLPNCVGAIDGKHIALKCPPNSVAQYFNYKHFFSIVLLAVSDANYVFTHVNIGAYGGNSDGGVLRESSFGKRLLNNQLPLPTPKPLPFGNDNFPYYFVGDNAFPLTPHLIRPYPGKQLSTEKDYFNTRLSRARRVIENAFGILVTRWRVLLNTLNLLPDNADMVVLACVALHNFLRLKTEASKTYLPPCYADWEDDDGNSHEGLWRREMTGNISSFEPTRHSHVSGGREAYTMRDDLKTFVNKYKLK